MQFEESSAIFLTVKKELRLIKITDCEQDAAQIGSPSTPLPRLMTFDPAFLEAIMDLYQRSYKIGRDLEW